MKKKPFIATIVVISIINAYLISSPTIFGRVGIWLFKYDYIKDFPSALLTIFFVIGILLLVCEIANRYLENRKKYIVLAGLTASSIGLLAYMVNQFTSPIYSLSGKSFVFGMYLLPITMFLIVINYLILDFKSR